MCYIIRELKQLIFTICLVLTVNILSSKNLCYGIIDEGKAGHSLPAGQASGNKALKPKPGKGRKTEDSTSVFIPLSPSQIIIKSPKPNLTRRDTTKLTPINSIKRNQNLNELSIKSNFAKNIMGYFIISPGTTINNAGVESNSYFKLFQGKRIASIRFVKLHPFGTSIHDTTLVADKWIEKAGNRLHMNTVEYKLRMQLQFHVGERVIPQLLAENEKLLRDKNYIEDVAIRLVPVDNDPDAVQVIIISKEKFEYGVNMGISPDASNLEVVNENMFGMGHRFNIGIAQKNAYLPKMGIYSSYHVDNIFGKFINTTLGISDTYIKKDWNISVERQFLTSTEENVGGALYDNVSSYNYIALDHPIALDTTVAYTTSDLWFAHAFPSPRNLLNKTILSFRYYHQHFNRIPGSSFGESAFLRNHDFFLTGVGFSKRNLYKNNLVYGYGVTEDIPYGHYYQINAGLDKSQFGVWPYLGFSLNNALIRRDGSYYCAHIALDGFFDGGTVRQGTFVISGNFFSRKFFAYGDPVRQFAKVELIAGINRFDEEYITIDNHFGIRDFHSRDLRGKCRLKFNFETVRYLKWSFYGFKFTNYLYADFAFLSDKLKTIFNQDFYAGIGTGLRIYNESLIFKIIDIRLSWFPMMPPGEINHFGANFQGITRSTFDDFLGKKPEIIRYQ